MATLDNLEIEIKASTEKAIKSIQNLSTVITGMSKNLDPTIDGLNRMADSLLRISSIDLKDVSDTLGSLKKYAKGISDVMSPDTKGMTSATAKLQRFGDKAQEVRKAADTLARSLAKEHGFGTDEKSITKVRNGIVQMFSVYDESDKFEKAKNNLIEMVKNLGYINNKNLDHSLDGVVDDARRFRDYVKESSILLPKDWAKELGDNATAKSVRGVLGIGNSNRDKSKGINLQTWVAQAKADNIPLPSGIDETSDEMEILTKVVEKLRSEYAITQGDVSGLNNALYNNAEVTEMVKGDVSSLSTVVRDMASEVQKVATPLQTIGEAANNAALPMDMFADSLERIGDVTLSDSLQNLSFVKDAISKLGGESGGRAGEALTQIAQGIKAFDGVTIPAFGDDLTNLAVGLRKLGSKTMVNAGQSLLPIARGLWSLSNITISTDVEALSKLAYALSRFGLSSMTKAADNMPKITKGVREMASSLASLPPVSESTIRLVEAMGNLNLRTNNASNSSRKLGLSLKSLTGHMNKANKSTKSLAATIGKIYASYWLLFRLFSKLGKAITLASDLKEVQNVVDVTFGDMAKKMDDFAKNAVDTLGMSELTAKEIGSKFQAMGSNMGISKAQVQSTNDFVQKATKGYADVADSMADISINLTRLAGDMASFYNQDYAEVAEKLQAVFTGQTRPLRAYGLDLTNATLQEWALNNGMKANIKTMTQAEKTLLRYQYVMAQTTAAHGDFIRTQDTWANSIKIAKERLKQLGVILGQIGIYTFKPLVQSFNKAMKRIIELAQGLLNSLGKIFGWQIEWDDGGVLQDDEEAAEGLADDMGDAADNAKKFKNFLLGIDELNVLPDKDDKDKDKGSGLGGLGGLGDTDSGFKLKKTQGQFESLYDTLFKLGKRIAEVEKEWLKGIDWDTIYKKARKFGEGLADFLNGYFSDIELFYHKGRFFANGINTIAHALDGFSKRFKGRQFGRDIGMMINGFTRNLDWKTIKSAIYNFAHQITEAVNGLLEGTNWYDVGRTIIEYFNSAVLFASTLVNEIEWMKLGIALGESLNGIIENWDYKELARAIKGAIQGAFDFLNGLLSTVDFAELGDKIGKFLSELNLFEYVDEIALLIWNVIKGAFAALGNIISEAPLESSLILAFAGFKFLGFGRTIGDNLSNSISVPFGTKLGTDLKKVFTTDITKLSEDSTGLEKVRNWAVGIAAAFVAAFEGYEVGKKLGAAMFPEDKMWYEEGIGDMASQISSGIKDGSIWGAWTAYLEDVSEETGRYAAYLDASIKQNLGVSWREFVEEVRSTGGLFNGNTISDEWIESFRQQLQEAGFSAKFVNDKINELRGAIESVDLGETVPEGATEKINNAKGAFDDLNEQLLNFGHDAPLKEAANSVVDLGDAVDDIDTDNVEDLEREIREVVGASDDASDSASDLSEELDSIYKSSKNSAEALAGIGKAFGNIGLSSEALNTLTQSYEDLDTGVQTFKTTIEELATTFGEKNTTMTETLTTTGESFTTFFEGIKTDAETLLNWFTETFEPRFTTDYWMTALSGVTTGFHDTFNNALEAVKEVWNQFAEWAKNNMKIKVPKTKLPSGKETEEVDLSVKVGSFYNGGFPEDGFFFANHSEMVGSFSNGKTAVANNEQIVEGIKQGVYEAVTAAWSSKGGNGGNVTVEITGDASDIFRAVVRENDRSIMRTGASPIRV